MAKMKLVSAKKKVTFKFKAPDNIHEVKLAGDFTGWEQGAIFMTKGRGGEWKAQVALEPGEHQYKFVADGNWLTDPAADRQSSNDQGIENSVRVVR